VAVVQYTFTHKQYTEQYIIMYKFTSYKTTIKHTVLSATN